MQKRLDAGQESNFPNNQLYMIRFDENLYMGYEGKTICRILGKDKININ